MKGLTNSTFAGAGSDDFVGSRGPPTKSVHPVVPCSTTQVWVPALPL